MQRERLKSRLGFILLSAGCAIGLGNVWRFPYITGKYGGATFVFLYLFFLLTLGLPIMVMEFAVGRSSQQSIINAFKYLEPKGTKWHLYSIFPMVGNYIIMAFYTTIAGWMIAYFFYTIKGDLSNITPTQVEAFFNQLLSSPIQITLWMILTVTVGFSICFVGLQKGVEVASKLMLSSLFFIMLLLITRVAFLEKASLGYAFYLRPNFLAIKEHGIAEIIYAALGQAFFTLSIGIGSMAIFGSYINKEKSLTSESLLILILDTAVAIMAGLIIFPACLAFNINPGSGPSLIFITLPNIFNAMDGGIIWGALFFLFLSFAALTTVIAVFENIVACSIDRFKWSRKKSVLINFLIVTAISLPCALGFNLLQFITPLGKDSSILDLEDFIVSNNLLPIGSLVLIAFCTSKKGWGWHNFISEANTGNGIKFPQKKAIYFYVKYIIPFIIIGIFIFGYIEKFFLK